MGETGNGAGASIPLLPAPLSLGPFVKKNKGIKVIKKRTYHHKRNQAIRNRGLNGYHCIHDRIHFRNTGRSHLTFLRKKEQ